MLSAAPRLVPSALTGTATPRVMPWATLLAAVLGLMVGLSAPAAAAALARDPAPAPAPTSRPGPGPYTVKPDARGVWWYHDAAGNRFLSLGVNNVTPVAWNPKPDTTYYNAAVRQFKGDMAAWATATRTLLTDHGFNTLGCWSAPEIPDGGGLVRTVVLYLVGHDMTRCLQPLRPGMEDLMRTNLRETMARYPDRSHILGVYFDNEMPWFGRNGWDRNPGDTLLETALDLPDADPARPATLAWLKQRHATPAALSDAWQVQVTRWEDLKGVTIRGRMAPGVVSDRTAFTAMLAERFYSAADRIVRAELPGMLRLGSRFAGDAPDAVITAAGAASDVMSLNSYPMAYRSNPEQLARFWLLGGKPIMITEYSFRARENTSGNPNTRGAGMVVDTQAQRAEGYTGVVTDSLTWPMVIGMHWFEFADQSPQGRFDGEDSNYGIVDVENRPYTTLLGAMKATNTAVSAAHAATARTTPTEMPKPLAVRYQPGQHPDRPSTLDLLAAPATSDLGTWHAPDATVAVARAGKALRITYSAGTQYGVGVDVFGPARAQRAGVASPATDVDGYTAIVLVAHAPKGVQMNLTLLEAAAGPPGQPRYDVGAGDDGEAFISLPLMGTGKPETYRVPIGDLLAQGAWGNQAGARIIQMTAMRNIGIQIQGQPDKGDVLVTDLRLER
jgi:hypothetical protein